MAIIVPPMLIAQIPTVLSIVLVILDSVVMELIALISMNVPMVNTTVIPTLLVLTSSEALNANATPATLEMASIALILMNVLWKLTIVMTNQHVPTIQENFLANVMLDTAVMV